MNYLLILFLLCISTTFISCSTASKSKSTTLHFSNSKLPIQFKNTLTSFSPIAFKKCYVPYLRKFRKGEKQKPQMGLLEYAITFDMQGRVKTVKTVKNEKLPKNIEQCVSRGIEGLDFKESQFTEFTIYYPITFNYR